MSAPPPAAGVRLPWSAMPARLHTALESWLGAPVQSAITQPGGFSPAVAARVRAADGRRVFVKACGRQPNPRSPGIYRQEARVVSALPASAPVPRLLWVLDEGEDDPRDDGGWILLVFEDVEGWSPAQPWLPAELDRVLQALHALSAALTPSPIAAARASEKFAQGFRGWQWLRAAPPVGLDPWAARHLDTLVALEDTAPAAVDGATLLHLDIRADNLLLTPQRVVVVDWPWACIGASWVDLVGFAPSVAMQGGPLPDDLLARSPTARAADPAGLTAAVAALAGFFTWHALQPLPPGLPTVRAFQAAQATVARARLARRTSLA